MIYKFKVPKNWTNTYLGKVAKWGSGGTPLSNNKDYYGGNIPWLIIGDLKDTYISGSQKSITELGLKNSSAKMVKPNSILIAMYGSIGKLGINKIPVSTNQAIAFTETLNDDVVGKYLFYYLYLIRSDLHKLGKGGTQKNISQTVLKDIPISYPSISEQHQIVEKIEELFSELDKGIENLKTAQQQLKVYRQAVLKSAFETEIHEKTITVESCCDKIIDCLHSTAKFTPSGKYCIDTTCIKDGKILFDKARFVSETTYHDRIARLKPKSGDILFAREGTVGTALIVPSGVDICLGQRMMMFRLNNEFNPKYFLYYIQSLLFKAQYRPLILGTTAPHLNIKDIKKFKVIYNTIKRQNEIIQEIESRLSVCDKIEETMAASLQQAEALRQSILKKAFEGKLVKVEVETPIVNLRALINTEDEREMQRKAIAGKIIELCHADSNFGHTKFQKTLHLTEYYAQFEFDANYIKEVAGPFDKDFFFPFLEEGKINNWFTEKPMRDIIYFKPAARLKTLTQNYNGIGVKQQQKVQFIIELLKDKTTAESELISTIYAVWNNYLISNREISLEQLIKEVYDWSESKSKFSKEDIFGTWQRMIEVGLEPVGFGKLIVK